MDSRARFERSVLGWIIFASIVGVLSGSASAVFLWLLDWVTESRSRHPEFIYGLPFCGAAIGCIYWYFGKSVASGNNLIIEEIHHPKAAIPFRISPLVLFGTVLTHLFGGSAGREGTAVQMGGGLADLVFRWFVRDPATRRTLIMAGVAAGFGSVFGTPVAGTVFGMEVLGLGLLRTDALIPCLVASFVADWVCRGYGIQHHAYPHSINWPLSPERVGWVVLAGVAFAAAAVCLIELTHRIAKLGQSGRFQFWIRPFFGGVVIILLTLAVGSQDYNGLSIPLIDRSLSLSTVFLGAFAIKIVFTSVTLGTGFKGGEVTPLFCIGATLGNAFGAVTHQDCRAFAALGFVGVFAAAANTPLSCVLMGTELFGGSMTAPLAITCAVAYFASGHRSIYATQRVHYSKRNLEQEGGVRSIAEWMDGEPE